jgi:hypothetical protein
LFVSTIGRVLEIPFPEHDDVFECSGCLLPFKTIRVARAHVYGKKRKFYVINSRKERVAEYRIQKPCKRRTLKHPVKYILDHRGDVKTNDLEFLVRFVNTDVPEENLNCPQLVEKLHQKLKIPFKQNGEIDSDGSTDRSDSSENYSGSEFDDIVDINNVSDSDLASNADSESSNSGN